MRLSRKLAALSVGLSAALVLAACGNDDDSTDTTVAAETTVASVETTAATETTAVGTETTAAGTETTAAVATGADLKAAGCPDPIVVQTDWYPEVDHSELYAVVAADGTIDKEKQRYTADIVDPRTGTKAGVKMEIRAGGPAVSFDLVTNQLYSDPGITLGYVSTDEAIAQSREKPTVAIYAPRERSPQLIMWDPDTYPDVKAIADLKAKGAKVRYFQGATYMDYLTGTGILDPKQVDPSYDGTPAAFVADGGKSAQQGFATAEPFAYKNVITEWGKDIAYQLIADTGYDIYAQSIAARPEDVQKLNGCFKALVPMLQAAQVRMKTDSKPVEELIAKIVADTNAGWTYTVEQAAAATQLSFENNIISNGPNATLGDFEEAKVQKVIEILQPIYAAKNAPVKDGLKPADVFTNEFIDTSIGLPA